MTIKDATRGTADLKALVASDPDFVRVLMRTALQEVLEAQMTETVGAAKGERTEDRLVTGLDTTAGRWSRGSASWSCGCHRIARAGSRPSCSSARATRSSR
jgi:Transposase, Mutator family